VVAAAGQQWKLERKQDFSYLFLSTRRLDEPTTGTAATTTMNAAIKCSSPSPSRRRRLISINRRSNPLIHQRPNTHSLLTTAS